jgi:hypothetical protein
LLACPIDAAVVEAKIFTAKASVVRVPLFWETILNNIRIISCFAGFTVSVSLFANTPTEHKLSPPTPVSYGETGVVLRVIDLRGVAIPNAQVTVKDEHGRAVISGNTDQHGLLGLPRLAAGSYTFSVSVAGLHFAEFQSFFSVGPDQSAEIEVAFKDPCYIDRQLSCDEFAAAPFFVDGFQKDSLMVIGPYPILEKPKPQPGFFKRLLARFHHR